MNWISFAENSLIVPEFLSTNMELKELIAKDAHFCWMEGDAFETLSNCFDVEAECLRNGEICESAGRFGYLLQGGGVIQRKNTAAAIEAGTLLGVVPGGTRGYLWEDAGFTARAESVVLWFQRDALEFACYRGCWFHARLIREIQMMLGITP